MYDLPPINSWADVQAQKLTTAERQLIAAARDGRMAKFGDTVPTEPTDDVLIRAPLLRYLILGGCAECRTPAKGVNVFGAWIAQELDLLFATAIGQIMLASCHIAEQPYLLQLQAAGLILTGSNLPKGLTAQGAIITGNLFLLSIHAQSEVNIAGAQITGQLDCDGATLENAKGNALLLQGASVQGGFLWRGIKKVEGRVDLNSAHFKDITDDAASWEKCANINLVGLTYDLLHGTPDLPARLAWLEKGAKWKGDFHPQPYEQLAKIWRVNGYRADAADVLVAKEHALAKATLARSKAAALPLAHRGFTGYLGIDVRQGLGWVWDHLLRIVAGYGHKPMRTVGVIFGLIAVTAFIALATWRAGDFVPNSAPILISDEWQAFAQTADNPAMAWTQNATAGRDYETFNALVYAADVVIPLVGFGQEVAWTPTTSRGPMGWVMLITKWVMIALGWIVTAIGAAAVTGIIRRE